MSEKYLKSIKKVWRIRLKMILKNKVVLKIILKLKYHLNHF